VPDAASSSLHLGELGFNQRDSFCGVYEGSQRDRQRRYVRLKNNEVARDADARHAGTGADRKYLCFCSVGLSLWIGTGRKDGKCA
jgi:hypothetical protein